MKQIQDVYQKGAKKISMEGMGVDIFDSTSIIINSVINRVKKMIRMRRRHG